jgi:hypothetical protein
MEEIIQASRAQLDRTIAAQIEATAAPDASREA